MKKRVISMILVLAISGTLFVTPAFAAYSYSPDYSARGVWDSYFSSSNLNSWAYEHLKSFDVFGLASSSSYGDVGWAMFDEIASKCVSTYGAFGAVSFNQLWKICSQFNSNFLSWDGSALGYYLRNLTPFSTYPYLEQNKRNTVWETFFGLGTYPEFHITNDVVDGTLICRIVVDVLSVNGSVVLSEYLTNSSGNFWFSYADSDDSSDAYAGSGTNGNDDDGMIWVNFERAVQLAQTGGALIANESQMALYLNWAKADRGSACKYLQLASYATIGALYTAITDTHDYFLGFRDFNSDGTHTDYVIVYPAGNNWYTGTQQTVTGVTDNSDALGSSDTQLNLNLGDIMMLDALNKFVVSPDGDVNFIDNVTFDMSSKTYKFADTVNYYYYDNRSYTWNYEWTYHINYTSVTYIGQSEEYDKHYEFYYELPDGRSSADLTAEELEQLNLSVDVLNYGRSADDVRLRSLYHFDGTTHDASYWNYATDFIWNTGASLTYMESGNFNGALYLDETEHDFTIKLPSSLGSGGFTVQWRMYQSYTAAPQLDSYVTMGAKLLQFNGSQILDRSGTVLASMPIGSWNEIAIIREDDASALRYYLNGIQIGTDSDSSVSSASYGPFIQFHFGADQQTYKQLDELRVLNYAWVSGGVNYSPTAVPHDTNLALVLPDSVVPVADEYLAFHSDGETSHIDFSESDYTLSSEMSGFAITGTDWTDRTYYHNVIQHPDKFLLHNPSYVTSSSSNGSVYLTCLSQPTTERFVYSFSYMINSYQETRSFRSYNDSICIPLILSWRLGSTCAHDNFLGIELDSNYCISLVDENGDIYSLNFTSSSYDTNSLDSQLYSASFDWGTLSYFALARNSNPDGKWNIAAHQGIRIKINPGTTLAIKYIDIRPQSADPLTVEKISSVTLMDSDSLNTPTLAVRSDIPVTNYQIGGVRPSAPYKGLVYAMVESGYITSLQIYDGQAWVSCDGRIWTGSRWIPYSSYNVITLSDMYDIADASGQSGYEYIYSESGFWSWFQKQWLAFREWCNSMYTLVSGLGSGSSGGGSSGGAVNDLEIDPDAADDDESAGWFVSFVKRVVKLGSRAVRGMSDAVFEDALSNVGEAVDNFSSFYSDDAVDPNEYVALLPIDDADSSDYELYGFKVYDRESVWQ